MGLLDGIGRFIQKTIQRGEQEVKKDLGPVMPMLDYFRDNFQTVAQHGAGDVLFHPQPVRADPAPFGNDKSVTYAPSQAPLYAGGGPSPNDVFQGALGDCYLLSSLSSAAALRPQSIVNAIHDNGDGTYTVTLYQPKGLDALRRLGWAGLQVESEAYGTLPGLIDRLPLEPVKVTVTGDVPVKNGQAQYAQPDTALWPAILEKAFAKLWGNYSAIGFGGSGGAALTALTGRPVQNIHFDTATHPDAVWRAVEKAVAHGSPAMLGSQLTESGGGEVAGLHGYALVGAYEENGQRYVVLRNPWGFNPQDPNPADHGDLTLTVDQAIRDFDDITLTA